MYDKEQIRINEELMSQLHQQEAINKENQAKIDRYHVCRIRLMKNVNIF